MGRAERLGKTAVVSVTRGRILELEQRLKLVTKDANQRGEVIERAQAAVLYWPYSWARWVAGRCWWPWKRPARLTHALRKRDDLEWLLEAKTDQRSTEKEGFRVTCPCDFVYRWLPGDARACPKCGRRWETGSQAVDKANALEGR